ncbi:recombinational DNA repair protein [Streptococcus phage Javan174]|uniref:recombinase RecT n=1 Tax=Streptococcus entericus TaxID=155680 RepID=UPI0003756F46|nr:recombinase RecT [Streptococcus entericus]QBX24080.1 recombinational DNA repair protein [Streptococcus phage Javan174]
MTQNQIVFFDNQTPQQAFNSPAVLKKFHSVLKGRETQFVASLLSIINSNKQLAKATNTSIMTAAMKAATLNLPIEPSLGMAYVVAYNRNEKQGNKWVKIPEAQFQIGYRGLIQLAQRSGQIKNINCDVVYVSEFIRYDKVYGELVLADEQADSGEVKGYFASIELVNGFRKMIFWTREKVFEHAKKYSKTYDKATGGFTKNTPWDTEFDAMALKTLLKELLSKYAPLSVEMQDAIIADNADSTVGDRQIKEAKPIDEKTESLDSILGQPQPKTAAVAELETTGIIDVPEAEVVDRVKDVPLTEDVAISEMETTPDTSYPADEIPDFVDEETGEIIEEISLFEGNTTQIKE